MYDARVGRWWSVDPLYKSNESSYVSLSNIPMVFIDTDGLNTTYVFDTRGNFMQQINDDLPNQIHFLPQEELDNIYEKNSCGNCSEKDYALRIRQNSTTFVGKNTIEQLKELNAKARETIWDKQMWHIEGDMSVLGPVKFTGRERGGILFISDSRELLLEECLSCKGTDETISDINDFTTRYSCGNSVFSTVHTHWHPVEGQLMQRAIDIPSSSGDFLGGFYVSPKMGARFGWNHSPGKKAERLVLLSTK